VQNEGLIGVEVESPKAKKVRMKKINVGDYSRTPKPGSENISGPVKKEKERHRRPTAATFLGVLLYIEDRNQKS